MVWKKYFTELTISRGREIFDGGLVSDMKGQDGSAWSAVVRDTGAARGFRVRIRLDGKGSLAEVACNCPAAAKGKRCAHMAAVCLAVEAETGEKDGGSPEAGKARSGGEGEGVRAKTPFGRLAGSREYHYFDLNHMTRELPLTPALCGEGRKLFKEGAVSLDEPSYGYPPERGAGTVGSCDAVVTDKGGRYRVSLRYDRDGILSLTCGCSSPFTAGDGRSWGSVCRHGAAALYALEDHILRRNPGDATDAGGMRVFRAYGGDRAGGAGAGEDGGGLAVLRLEPRLEGCGRAMAAGFKVGTDKLFVIRDLREFSEQIASGGTGTFGRSTVIDYSACALDEDSRRCLRFIREALEEEDSREDYAASGLGGAGCTAGTGIRGTIPLVGGYLDEFYDLVRDRELEYVPRGDYASTEGRRAISCRDGQPAVRLTVRKSLGPQGRFEGVTVTGEVPVFTEGLGSCYRVTEDGFLERTRKDSVQFILPLCREAGPDGDLSLSVGRAHLAWFCRSLLPGLREYGAVAEPDAEFIAGFVPPEPEFRFCLDAEDRNPSCRVIAVYGETEADPADLLRLGGGAGLAGWRDGVREREILDRVLGYFPEYDKRQGEFCCGDDSDAVFRVLSRGVPEFMKLGEVSCTERFLRMKIRPMPRVTVGVSLESGLLGLDINCEGISREDLLRVVDAYRARKKYIRLRNGDFLRTDGGEESVESLADMLDALRVSPKEFVKGKMRVPAYRALYLDRMLEDGIFRAKRDSGFRQLVEEFRTAPDSDAEVPESLAPVLRGYQTEGYKWLRALEAHGFAGILADDMGLGKTLQVIAVLLAWKEEGKKGTSLVVCPASLVYNWGEEIARFAPRLEVGLAAGTQAEREAVLADYGRYDVLVTSYDLLKRDIDRYEGLAFLGQVLDEAQFIKNHNTAAAKSAKLINSRYRFALTGTPVENNVSELWSIFDFLMPGFLYSYDVFRKEIENPVVRRKEHAASERLRRMVGPFILRRLKKDVLEDLPDKIEEVVRVKAGEEQQLLCDSQAARIQGLLSSQDGETFRKNRVKTLAELTRLREICCDPSLVYEDYGGGSAKRDACLELIIRALESGHRLLVFSQFTTMLALLEQDMRTAGIAYYRITGATPKRERTELVRAFNGDRTPVFLISLKAGGTGLNLTGADMVIHYDPWWNMAVEDQATDRAHRIGQTRVVTEYKLILKDSVEEGILKMQEAKSDLAEGILSGEGDGGQGPLTREDILELLGT